jgi:hypothetical protein
LVALRDAWSGDSKPPRVLGSGDVMAQDYELIGTMEEQPLL